MNDTHSRPNRFGGVSSRFAVFFGLAVMGLAAAYLFAWRVDEQAFVKRGWHADLESALAAARRSGRPLFVKLGAPT